jgi:SAM-dependent methyltransferase
VNTALQPVRRLAGKVKRRIVAAADPARAALGGWPGPDEPPQRRAWLTADHACLICGWCGPNFEPPHAHVEGNRCPQCGSIGRDRFLLHCMAARVDYRPGLRMLETSPRMGQAYRDVMSTWFDYTTSDFDERAHRGAIKVDLQDIDLPDHSFDVVCTAHVLEHVPDTDAAISELHRIVTPGGWLLLQVPLLQATTAPPSEPEFHGDDTPVFWRFGFDLTARLREQGFTVELLVTDELRDLVVAGAERWYGTSSEEFDADGIVAGAAPFVDDLVGVADRALAARSGFEPAYMFGTWACRRPSA